MAYEYPSLEANLPPLVDGDTLHLWKMDVYYLDPKPDDGLFNYPLNAYNTLLTSADHPYDYAGNQSIGFYTSSYLYTNVSTYESVTTQWMMEGEYTIEFWYKRTSSTTSSVVPVLSYGSPLGTADEANNCLFTIYWQSSYGPLAIGFDYGAHVRNVVSFGSCAHPAVDTWLHVAVIRRKDPLFNRWMYLVYFDGLLKEVKYDSVSPTTTGSNNRWQVNRLDDSTVSGNQYWYVDDIRVSSKARSAMEVYETYMRSRGKDIHGGVTVPSFTKVDHRDEVTAIQINDLAQSISDLTRLYLLEHAPSSRHRHEMIGAGLIRYDPTTDEYHLDPTTATGVMKLGTTNTFGLSSIYIQILLNNVSVPSLRAVAIPMTYNYRVVPRIIISSDHEIRLYPYEPGATTYGQEGMDFLLLVYGDPTY